MIAPDTPTIASLAESIINSIQSRLGVTRSLLAKSFILPFAYAVAAALIILYKFGNFILAQQFPATASADPVTIFGRSIVPLRAWGDLKGVRPPDEGSAAVLRVAVTVTEQSGSILAGEQLTGTDNGVTYLVLETVPLNSPQVQVLAEAIGDQQGGDGVGTIGNLDVGAEVAFSNPVANIQRIAEVSGVESTGTDAEDIDGAYRRRVLNQFRLQPQGGALADYKLWAEGVPGVANAYVYVGEVPGTVRTYVEAVGTVDGIAGQSLLYDVHDAQIYDADGLATRNPVSSVPEVASITRAAFTVTITGLDEGSGSLADLQSAISAAVEEYFEEREPYIRGLSLNPRTDKINIYAVSGVVFDVSESLGGTFSTVAMTDGNGDPVEDYALAAGEKARVDVVYAA